MPFVEIDGQKIDVDAMLMDIERTECEDSLYEFLRKGWKAGDSLRFEKEPNTSSREKKETLQGKFGLAVENVGQSHYLLYGIS